MTIRKNRYWILVQIIDQNDLSPFWFHINWNRNILFTNQYHEYILSAVYKFVCTFIYIHIIFIYCACCKILLTAIECIWSLNVRFVYDCLHIKSTYRPTSISIESLSRHWEKIFVFDVSNQSIIFNCKIFWMYVEIYFLSLQNLHNTSCCK